jgi:hypothetical protein
VTKKDDVEFRSTVEKTVSQFTDDIIKYLERTYGVVSEKDKAFYIRNGVEFSLLKDRYKNG